MTEQGVFFNHIIGVLFFFALFFDEPVEELHRLVVVDLCGFRVDVIDQRGNILFVFQTCFQRIVRLR